MTITRQDELDGLKEIGRIVANTLQAMARAMEPGMTTGTGRDRAAVSTVRARSRPRRRSMTFPEPPASA